MCSRNNAACWVLTVDISMAFFLTAWFLASIIMITKNSNNFNWNNNAVATTGAIFDVMPYDGKYNAKCDPQCVKGCKLCEYPCYSMDVGVEYNVSNKRYTYYENRIRCWADHSKFVAVVNATEDEVGIDFPIFYNSTNPADFALRLKSNEFLQWAIAFPVVFVASAIFLTIFNIKLCKKCN